MRLIPSLALAGVAALVAAGAASAHIKLDPAKLAAGSDARFTVLVPSEDPKAPTTKVAIRFPASIVSASFEAKPGWKRTVTIEKLAKPVVLDGETIVSRIGTVTWTATAGGIAPGDFATFSVLIAVPDKAGAKLSFPTVQTYGNGKVMRWIGPADSEEPAPLLTVGPAEAGA